MYMALNRLLLYLFAGLSGVAACASCGKQEPSGASSREVFFRLAEAPLFVETGTKASVVTEENLSSFYVSATNGAAGSETQVWNSVLFSDGGSGLFMAGDGGKFWPIEDAGWHFFASNVPLGFDASGCYVQAETDTDVVCAMLDEPGFQQVNTLVFSHVLSRVGSVTVTAEEGYTVSNISVRVVPRTSGTLNLRTGAWGSIGYSAAQTLSGTVPGTRENDLFVIPGEYILLVSWRASMGSYQEDFVDMPAEVTFSPGVVSSLSMELGGSGRLLGVTVTVLPWDSHELADPNGKEGGYWV